MFNLEGLIPRVQKDVLTYSKKSNDLEKIFDVFFMVHKIQIEPT